MLVQQYLSDKLLRLVINKDLRINECHFVAPRGDIFLLPSGIQKDSSIELRANYGMTFL